MENVEQLKNEYLQLHNSIYVEDIYDRKNLMRLKKIEKELIKHDIVVLKRVVPSVTFKQLKNVKHVTLKEKNNGQ